MRISRFVLLLITLFLLFPLPVYAQQPSAITVVPSVIHLDLATDKPQAELLYKNNSNQTVELTLSASDFTELEDGYKLSFLDKKDAQNYKYSLSSWISFSDNNIVIEPHQTTSVTVFVDANKLTFGGHYATILATIDAKANTEKNVQIQGILASLLFVRTHTGHEIENASIQSFTPQRNILDFPGIFSLRFNNTGDTVLTPYGLVEITDPFGHRITKGILNEDSRISLPETIRRYDIPLRKPTTFLFPGIYTANLSIHFGKTNITQKKEITFFSRGSIPVIPLILTFLILIPLWIYYRRQYPTVSDKKQ